MNEINFFKEFHRPKKPCKAKSDTDAISPKTRKFPGITNSVKNQVFPPGEDAVSYKRHIKAL